MHDYPNHSVTYEPVDKIPYRHMTEYVTPNHKGGSYPDTPENRPDAGSSAPGENRAGTPTENRTGTQNGVNAAMTSGAPEIPLSPPGDFPRSGILPVRPEFNVPSNPLLPPGYQETINYENVQYLNGFLRSQIGKYIKVTQLIGSDTIEDQHGYLVGVGLNYILLQELETGNIIALDYYTLKEVYIYHNESRLPKYEEIL